VANAEILITCMIECIPLLAACQAIFCVKLFALLGEKCGAGTETR
jgi:hypothetical protein